MLSIVTRIEHVNNMRGPKYKHVHDMVIRFLKVVLPRLLRNTYNQEKMFLGPKIPNIGGNAEDRMIIRKQYLESFIFNLEENQRIRQHLVNDCGYSPDLWKRNIYLAVDLAVQNNVYENFRSALLGCYG